MKALLTLLLLQSVANAFQFAPKAVNPLVSRPGDTRHAGLSSRNSKPATTALPMSDDTHAMEKKIKGRKKRVLLGYRLTALSFIGASGMTISKSGITPFSCYTVAGPLLAAGMACPILSGAAVNNRLGSDTYKRLNLFLANYGAIGLTMAALVPQPTLKSWYFWVALSFVTFVNSIKGYGYGVKGWKLEGGMSVIKDDIANQIKTTFKRIFSVPSNLQSTGYLATTLLAASLTVMKLVELVGLVVAKSDATLIASRLGRFGKLALLAGVSFTLKDAADRGRLEGTPFIQLNFLSSFFFGSLAAHLYNGAGSSITALSRATTVFSIMTAFFGCLGLVFKKNKIDYHDATLKDKQAERLPDDFPLED